MIECCNPLIKFNDLSIEFGSLLTEFIDDRFESFCLVFSRIMVEMIEIILVSLKHNAEAQLFVSTVDHWSSFINVCKKLS